MFVVRPRPSWFRRASRWVALAIAAWLAASSLALQPTSSTFAAGTIDQQQTGEADPALAGGATWVAQTFIAGRTGNLDQVELSVANGGGSGDVTVEIRNTVGNLPGSTVLATTTVLEAILPIFAPAFMSFEINPPAPVVAGTKYAIVIRTPGMTTLTVAGSLPEAYANGEALLSTNSGASYGAAAIADYAFKTYVENVAPTATFTPTATPTLTPTLTLTPTMTPTLGACSATPRVAVSLARVAANQYTATVRANGTGNVLKELRFGAARNASITAGTQTGTGSFVVSLTPNPATTTFTVRRVTSGQAVQVPLVVLDNCGTWSTFVGAGPSAQ